MVNSGWTEGGTGREKLIVVHQNVATMEKKKTLGNRRVKVRRSLNKTKGAGSTRVRVPEGRRIKHAGAEHVGVVRVAELEVAIKGEGWKVIGGKDVDHGNTLSLSLCVCQTSDLG